MEQFVAMSQIKTLFTSMFDEQRKELFLNLSGFLRLNFKKFGV